MIAERTLWHGRLGEKTLTCSLRPGCVGVDLLIIEGEQVIRRERYPDQSTACERSRDLNSDFVRRGYVIEGSHT